MMRVAIDAWDPGYGAGAADARALVPSEVPTDPNAEVPIERWAPRRAHDAPPWESVVFVDGVQRIDARAWVTGDDGITRQGLCVSVAAGAVRCDGRAEVLDIMVDRALVSPVEGADHLVTRHGVWRHVPVADDDIDVLDKAIARLRSTLEVSLAQRVAAAGDQIVVDGPLSQHRHLAGALGYVKTLQRGYGPPDVLRVAGELQPGERTPMLIIGESVARWSWYVRLPGAIVHPLAGVVRCEAAGDLSPESAAALADCSARSLPRFASAAHKDTRAPQNLYPIAGLERVLRARLGDQGLLLRALRSAAA
ncbi:MAG TPA: hypothetical protein VGZ52_13340 [Acidimicrobiales bacterium]|jgi:hypothetical protein|nr:hypothetical protein [Acidimicrobiales bacterium]